MAPIEIRPEDGGSGGRDVGLLMETKYDYDYPDGLDLRPKSELHRKLRDEIMIRARYSQNLMQRRYPSWREIDQTLTAYIPLDEKEQAVKDNDPRRPVSIVIPMSYATIETLLTYRVAALLDDPVFRYRGVGPEDTIGAILLEKVVAHQCMQAKVALNLYTSWRDDLAYGMGIVSPIWEKIVGQKTVRKEKGFISTLTNMFMKTGYSKKTIETTLFEGTRTYNIDPYDYLPDPNVPAHEIQRSEFVGWRRRTNRMGLLDEEYNGNAGLFNVKYLEHIDGRSSLFRFQQTGRSDDVQAGWSDSSVSPVDVIYMCINIIPKELKLGASEEPQKWLFGLAGDQVVICARPLKDNHNMYPVVVCSTDYDGYSVAPVSRLEMNYGLQTALNFMFNSHVKNVRKTLNNMFLINPDLVNVFDFEDPDAGLLLKLRRKAWDQDLDKVVKQFQVQDVTRGNIADAHFIIDMNARVSSAADSLMGIMRAGGERRSATEAQGVISGALSRLEKASKIASLQQMYDLAYIYACNTNQHMEEKTYVRITGEWEEELRAEYGRKIEKGHIKVSPTDVLVDWDIIPQDGSVPSGENADAWIQFLNILTTKPEFAAGWEISRIIMHTMRVLGAKNVHDFRKRGPINAVVQPDEQVMDQVQRGNLEAIPQGAGMA